MRLTVDQRLQALEREVVVLRDMLELLHKMLKNQGGMISDYIVQKVAESNPAEEGGKGSARPAQELYAFVCKQRFDKVERDLRKVMQMVEGLRFKHKAG
jgi:hypothetical protein